jgi:hypothetical protein
MFEQLSTATNMGIEAVQKRIEAKLKYALQERLRWYLDIEVSGFTVVLPADSRDPDLPVLVVNTGERREEESERR